LPIKLFAQVLEISKPTAEVMMASGEPTKPVRAQWDSVDR
jgi:hypothetical protein